MRSLGNNNYKKFNEIVLTFVVQFLSKYECLPEMLERVIINKWLEKTLNVPSPTCALQLDTATSKEEGSEISL